MWSSIRLSWKTSKVSSPTFLPMVFYLTTWQALKNLKVGIVWARTSLTNFFERTVSTAKIQNCTDYISVKSHSKNNISFNTYSNLPSYIDFIHVVTCQCTSTAINIRQPVSFFIFTAACSSFSLLAKFIS